MATLAAGQAYSLGRTHLGQRLIGEAVHGSFDGRLRGRLLGTAGDWMTITADGIGLVDARLLLKTDDGATIAMAYTGRTLVTPAMTEPIYVVPVFETADPRYRWLTSIQAVGRGRLRDGALTYQIFELV